MSANASDAIDFRQSGSETAVNARQPLNARAFTAVTVAGSVTFASDRQPLKQSDAIVVSGPASVIDASDVQPMYAPTPSVATFAGTYALVIAVQFLNA